MTPAPFSQILARERKARGMSQDDLAAQLQVSRQAISKWEIGDAMPDLHNLIALADVLGLSLDALCGRVPRADTDSAAVSAAPAVVVSGKLNRALLAACAILSAALLLSFLLWFQCASDSTRDFAPQNLLSSYGTDFSVTGLSFVGETDYQVAYQFVPSISSSDLTYQITFSGFDQATTLDAACESGVCSGVSALPSGFGSYTVTVSVSDGTTSYNVAVASNLSFSRGSASWTPPSAE